MEEELFEIRKISNKIFQIQEKYYQSWNRASMYLFLYGEESVLVDTGTGIYNPITFLMDKKVLKKAPKMAIATHVHYDHVGGHRFFNDSFYIHEYDATALQNGDVSQIMSHISEYELCPKPNDMKCCQDYKVDIPAGNLHKLQDGDVFSVGDDKIEIIHLPGHTPGSIGVLSHNLKTLCTGDMLFSSSPMLDSIPGQGSRLHFSSSMKKIIRLIESERVDLFLPGHGEVFDSDHGQKMASRYLEFAVSCPEYFSYF